MPQKKTTRQRASMFLPLWPSTLVITMVETGSVRLVQTPNLTNKYVAKGSFPLRVGSPLLIKLCLLVFQIVLKQTFKLMLGQSAQLKLLQTLSLLQNLPMRTSLTRRSRTFQLPIVFLDVLQLELETLKRSQ